LFLLRPVGLMNEQSPVSDRAAADLPPRPPESQILVVNDDDGFTIVIPPRMSRLVVWMFVMTGANWLLACVWLGLLFVAVLCTPSYAVLYTPSFWTAPAVFLSLFGVIYQLFAGFQTLRRAKTWLKQWTCLTVQGGELEVRYCGLRRESRVRWPCSKIGRIYVEMSSRRTACLGIQVVGVDRINLSNASQAEWEWVAALLRHALNRGAIPQQTSVADGASPVDEIISNTSKVGRP
jgi:membrane protein YdbS with pleckstrin-like domain